MTPADRVDDARSDADEAPADEAYARAYASGYEEGLRSGLRDVLAHASRGRTNQELRALILGRLARLAEEVDLKRRSLLGPPAPRAFDDLLRAPRPPGVPSPSAPAAKLVGPGGTLLVREVRPARAVDVARASAARFPRLVVVSPRPPDLAGVPCERIVVPVRSGPESDGGGSGPGDVAGRLREPTEAPGGALVYVDALELFATEAGPELTLRFVGWLTAQVQRTRSALIASYDPRALEGTDAGRLERLFGDVEDRTEPARLAPP